MANISTSLWRGPRSYFITSGPGGTTEVDCFSCGHCNRVVFCCDPVSKEPRSAQDVGGTCNNCHGMICPRCVDRGTCVPLERAIEQMEARDRWRRECGV